MIIPLAQIRLTTHSVYVSMSELHIHILKYNDRGCDYELFDHSDSLLAGDYILEPLSSYAYKVTFEGESDEWRPSIINPRNSILD